MILGAGRDSRGALHRSVHAPALVAFAACDDVGAIMGDKSPRKQNKGKKLSTKEKKAKKKAKNGGKGGSVAESVKRATT